MKMSMYELKKQVIDILSLNKGSSVSREHLVDLTMMDDRAVRSSIEELRQDGYPIVNGYRDGYRLANNQDEYLAWRKKEMSRAKSILFTISKMDEGYNNLNQLMIEDLSVFM